MAEEISGVDGLTVERRRAIVDVMAGAVEVAGNLGGDRPGECGVGEVAVRADLGCLNRDSRA